VTAPTLPNNVVYRRGVSSARAWSDRWLAADVLIDLHAAAIGEARDLARAGQDWPRWVTAVFEYQCECRDRWAVRRELAQMAEVADLRVSG